jgi:hypothetical protein
MAAASVRATRTTTMSITAITATSKLRVKIAAAVTPSKTMEATTTSIMQHP